MLWLVQPPQHDGGPIGAFFSEYDDISDGFVVRAATEDQARAIAAEAAVNAMWHRHDEPRARAVWMSDQVEVTAIDPDGDEAVILESVKQRD